MGATAPAQASINSCRDPAQIDRKLRQRQPLAPSVRGVAHRDELAEIRLVLDPVEVQAKDGAACQGRAVADQNWREQRGEHVAGSVSPGLGKKLRWMITRSRYHASPACHRKSIFLVVNSSGRYESRGVVHKMRRATSVRSVTRHGLLVDQTHDGRPVRSLTTAVFTRLRAEILSYRLKPGESS